MKNEYENMKIFNTFPNTGVKTTVAMKTVLRTMPDCVTVTPWHHLMTDSWLSGVHLWEGLGRIEGGDQGEGHPGNEGAKTDKEQVCECLCSHSGLRIFPCLNLYYFIILLSEYCPSLCLCPVLVWRTEWRHWVTEYCQCTLLLVFNWSCLPTTFLIAVLFQMMLQYLHICFSFGLMSM